MASGFIGILSFDLHFPEGSSLKGKRKELLSLKADLQRRVGASVAEVDYHELWQRARLTWPSSTGTPTTSSERLGQAERLAMAGPYEAGPFQREVVTPEDLEP